ncbi:MAG: hypothetical protein IKP68_09330 [Clostridia bacterium]|nr:hypothetical protein [Clostridia bacterium]
MCKLYYDFDAYYDITIFCTARPEYTGDRSDIFKIGAKYDEQAVSDFQSFYGKVKETLYNNGFEPGGSYVDLDYRRGIIDTYYSDLGDRSEFSMVFDIRFEYRDLSDDDALHRFEGRSGESVWDVVEIKVNGIWFSDFESAEKLFFYELKRGLGECKSFVPAMSPGYRLVRAKQQLLQVDEKYALFVKSKLERMEFAKTVLSGLLMAPIEKELTRDMIYDQYGRHFGFTIGLIQLDFEKMICTIMLNEVTKARIRIVDRPGRHDVRPGVYAVRHKRPEVEPLPTPEEELRAVEMRHEYPELIEKCRREMAEAARAVGSVFTEFLEAKCFYANVKLDGGEVVPLSPELIEELLEKEYVYVSREDVKVYPDHWLVTIKGASKYNITNLTGDGKVLCDRPKRWKGKK